MNWYLKCCLAKAKALTPDGLPTSYFIGGERLDANEKIYAAAVLASKKIYTGTSHAVAQQKAIDDGAAKILGSEFVSTDGSMTHIDLFITTKRRIIDRTTALRQRGIFESEDVNRQKIPQGLFAS